MLVRYFLTEEPAMIRDAPVAVRVERVQRVESFATLTGGLILVVMMATLLLTHG